jgi:aspartate/methionine/tyrosine aminotransferase
MPVHALPPDYLDVSPTCEGRPGSRSGCSLKVNQSIGFSCLDPEATSWEGHDVAVAPGSCFGLAPYFRLSYATSEQNLREALKRIARACREMS